MQPASRAPGVSSVGMIRAIAASIVARWRGLKKVSDMGDLGMFGDGRAYRFLV